MNTKRSFLKSLISLPLLTFVKPKESKTLLEFKDKEPDFVKEITYEEDGLQFNLFITTNFLITLEKDQWTTNTYGTLYMCCCQITSLESVLTERKRIRMESKIILKEKIKEVWQDEFNKLAEKGKNLFKEKATPIGQIPFKVKV